MNLSSFLSGLAGCFLALMVGAHPVSAHETRKVGDYDFVVGFLNEPAFSGEMNGIDLRISKEGTPVEGLEQHLRAVVYDQDRSRSLPLPLRKRYKKPGEYAGYFLPAVPGKYVFEISGMIEDHPVKEVFVSGESFHDVEDSDSLRFPR